MDRITTLPQPIIETVLCILPIEEAARTSILSREWRYKWTSIPKLEFDERTVYNWTSARNQLSDSEQISHMANARKNMDERCKLFYAIHQVLLSRQGPIHELSLSVRGEDCFEIDQIILHLSRNHLVKKLTLNLPFYSLPLCVFSLHHLKDLYLAQCGIKHKQIINGFGSLTSLSLDDVHISRKTLLHLLSNCPSLKRLSLLMVEDNFRDETPTIMELFKCLPMIEHLTFSGEVIWFLVRALEPQDLSTSLIHLKYVCMEDLHPSNDNGLTFLAVLVKCSPNLEKIKLKLHHDCDFEYECYMLEKYPVTLEKYSDVWLERLNELEIEDFRNLKHEMELAKFILARSPNLKKVILLIDDRAKELELKVLLRTSRASPVEIVIKDFDRSLNFL